MRGRVLGESSRERGEVDLSGEVLAHPPMIGRRMVGVNSFTPERQVLDTTPASEARVRELDALGTHPHIAGADGFSEL
jgi:hypothetical protein